MAVDIADEDSHIPKFQHMIIHTNRAHSDMNYQETMKATLNKDSDYFKLSFIPSFWHMQGEIQYAYLFFLLLWAKIISHMSLTCLCVRFPFNILV